MGHNPRGFDLCEGKLFEKKFIGFDAIHNVNALGNAFVYMSRRGERGVLLYDNGINVVFFYDGGDVLVGGIVYREVGSDVVACLRIMSDECCKFL